MIKWYGSFHTFLKHITHVLPRGFVPISVSWHLLNIQSVSLQASSKGSPVPRNIQAQLQAWWGNPPTKCCSPQRAGSLWGTSELEGRGLPLGHKVFPIFPPRRLPVALRQPPNRVENVCGCALGPKIVAVEKPLE